MNKQQGEVYANCEKVLVSLSDRYDTARLTADQRCRMMDQIVATLRIMADIANASK